ncbi:hypothetical protein W02_41330 [Nitrospira sp. KM1]|uniref:PilZ domain-containing protein n=1 Tax=Nitrospira sp. KM1 TaxID=1936990 RepID=UPI0013A79D90|nr:PilZ domain-containing protein [Nitrospira sp. KM1]BCA56993.1 hypothetical protein W02_41330 [Nitrospira sp. KM1]
MTHPKRNIGIESRRHPRIRVTVPFSCSFIRIGLARWAAEEKAGCGVVFDVSLAGARIMSPVRMSPGDELAVSLRLPQQVAAMNVDATVRWQGDHVFGLEFVTVTQSAETRLQKFLARTVAAASPSAR